MKKPLLAVATVATLVGSVMIASPASAASSPFGKPSDIATGLVTPLSLAVDSAGTTYVAQNFAGQILRIPKGGTPTPLVSAPGQELGAVSVRGGTVYYAQSTSDPASPMTYTATSLWSVPASGGTPTKLKEIRPFEVATNPDSGLAYGFVGISAECAAQLPPGFPAEYTGLVDSHPYATAADSRGVFIADAGANAVFKVGYDGSISTVAVLPPAAPLRVTADYATQNGFPACVADFPLVSESVPTDVEIGPGGQLYVTALPGGPEDPSLGARGSVYKVNPTNGRVSLVATGFGGATGLAVTPLLGVVFVAELFGGPQGTGRVSVVLPGFKKPTASVAVSQPAAIEYTSGRVYVTRDALGAEGAPPAGKVTVVPLLARFS